MQNEQRREDMEFFVLTENIKLISENNETFI